MVIADDHCAFEIYFISLCNSFLKVIKNVDTPVFFIVTVQYQNSGGVVSNDVEFAVMEVDRRPGRKIREVK